ncbi:MAG: UvrD-helicase domain-containing protein [Armatimonadota bacterium]
MKAIELTDEQKSVVERTTGEFVVIASAGSGKTTVLSERYLNLIQNHGIRPSQILTITFTKRAAAEMKGRIVAKLRERHLLDEAQEAETGPIQTIHSFYERVLRENSPAAGLDPKFEVVTGGESARLTTECIKRAISYAEEEGGETRFALKRLAGKTERDGNGSYAKLMDLVGSALRSFRDSGHPRTSLASLYTSPEDFLRNTDEDLKALLPAAFRPPIGETNWHGDVFKDLKANKQQGAYPWLKPVIPPGDSLNGARIIVGLAQLALTAWAMLEDEHRKNNHLDYTALEARTVRLLESSPEVRDRLNRQYRHVMVDESQDLNPNQMRLLKAIQPESKMLVGDDKQSIFLFRNAVGNFIQGYESDQILRLSKSHRSEQPIQQLVDMVFASAMQATYQPMTSVLNATLEDAPWQPSQTHSEVLMLGAKEAWHEVVQRVRNLQLEGVKLNDIAVLTANHKHGKVIASYLRRNGIGVRESAGKANYYAKLEVRDICNTLTALADPENRFALIACLRSPVCELSLDTTVMIGAFEGKPFDFQPELAEDQAKFERFKKWFLPLRELSDRLPAWEVISQIMAESDLLQNLATRQERRKRIENVRKLLVMAAAKPELNALEYAAMIKDIERLSDAEVDPSIVDPTEDLVTTITIHSAKGLEWPVVILADAMMHKVRSVYAPVFDPERGWFGYWQRGANTYSSEFIKEQEKENRAAELLRLQYVAMTRAKKKLILVGWEGNRAGLIELVRSSIGSAAFSSIITTAVTPE